MGWGGQSLSQKQLAYSWEFTDYGPTGILDGTGLGPLHMCDAGLLGLLVGVLAVEAGLSLTLWLFLMLDHLAQP